MTAFYCAECDGPVGEYGHECAADSCGNCGHRRDDHDDGIAGCSHDPCPVTCHEWRNP